HSQRVRGETESAPTSEPGLPRAARRRFTALLLRTTQGITPATQFIETLPQPDIHRVTVAARFTKPLVGRGSLGASWIALDLAMQTMRGFQTTT
ncbi:hypothetical protein ABTK93_19350, partial [Acinetobacter baumannii]